jgi:hypothetical protein
MSQNFKLKFSDVPSNKTSNTAPQGDNVQNSDTPTSVRNLCFEWPNGNMKFLNYTYLVTCEFYPDQSQILIVFTSDTISIVGSGLATLFEELLNHIPKRIICINPRYAQTDDSEVVITSIEILKNVTQ